jgi:hypothetical protein
MFLPHIEALGLIKPAPGAFKKSQLIIAYNLTCILLFRVFYFEKVLAASEKEYYI